MPVFSFSRDSLPLEDRHVAVLPVGVFGVELEHERDDALVDVDDRVLLGLLVALRRQSRDAVGTQSGIIIWKAKSSGPSCLCNSPTVLHRFYNFCSAPL